MDLRIGAASAALAAVGLALAACETIDSAADTVGDAAATAIAELDYRATLTGAAEVPGPGDPDGSGEAEIRLIDATDDICYDLDVRNIGPATAAHIHRGAAGEAGPPVVTLDAPSDGGSEDCTDITDDLLDEIEANPAGFYVNIHNAEYPAGAIRGQLMP